MRRRKLTIGVAAGVLALVIAGMCVAQPPANGNRGNRGDRGDRGPGGNFDPAQMRERMMERWKEQLGADDQPIVITQNEFMRRMKDMSATGGNPMMSFYGEMPDSYNLVVNTAHPLVDRPQ